LLGDSLSGVFGLNAMPAQTHVLCSDMEAECGKFGAIKKVLIFDVRLHSFDCGQSDLLCWQQP
jgi:hypothetical protein